MIGVNADRRGESGRMVYQFVQNCQYSAFAALTHEVILEQFMHL